MHIAFFGLGNMGFPIAANLLKHGHTVTAAIHRDPAPALQLQELGAAIAASPAEAHFPRAGPGIDTSSPPQMRTNASRTHRKSSPLLLLNAPGTFSQTAYLGYSPFVASLISLMIRIA